MILSGILRFAAGTINCILAFLVALLPERIKEREPFSRFQSNAAHFLSGISECAFSLALFAYGYGHFVGGILQEQSNAFAGKGFQTTITEGQMGGMGVLSFVLYLIHPVALISLYLFIEGIVRAFAAASTGHRHGIAAFWAIHKITAVARTKRLDSIQRRQLGPEAPDSVQKGEPSGTLVLTSTENKDWLERQVAQCGDDFYILSEKNFIQRGRYYRYRYTFRQMHPGEIIRGRIRVLPTVTSHQ